MRTAEGAPIAYLDIKLTCQKVTVKITSAYDDGGSAS
jgi:hypothetical protein